MNIHHITHGGDFYLPSATAHFAPSLSIEPFHLCLKLHVDIESKKLVATVSYDVHVHRKEATLSLDAVDMDIHSVSSKDDIEWNYDGEKIHIHWNNTQDGQDSRVDIQYSVTKPISGALFGSNYMGTDHETGRARYWIPCIDHSAVRTSLDIYVEHRTEHTCVSAGSKIHTVATSEGWSETYWKFDGRCPIYLFCIIVGDLNSWDGGEWNGIPIAGFAPKPTPVADIERAFSPTAELLSFMTDKLGPLPWPKYFQFAMPDIGGAMENISLVSWDSFWVFDETMHADWGELLDQINLHEMAHTWFGDLVVCRDYAHVWLKESWATYMEAVWFEDCSTIERFEYELLFKRERYFTEVATRYSRPIMTRTFDTPWQMYDMHLYPGGAVRLHMLRKKIGDKRFWNGVRDYLETYAYQVVETDDFRKVLEKHAHQSLAEFFEMWFCKAGYPFLDIKHSFDKDAKLLSISAKQSIKGAATGEESKYFSFPLEILIQDEHDEWHSHTLAITQEMQHCTIPLSKAPKQIVIDPHASSVMDYSFQPGVSMLAQTLQDCSFVNARIHAYRTLIKDGKRIGLEKVHEHLEHESFYGTKVEAIKALSSSKHPISRDILCSLLHSEEDPRVQAEVASACGSHKDASIAASLDVFLSKTNLPYRAHGNALVSMAKQKEFCREEHLFQALEDQGWWGYVRKMGASAIGHLQTKKAADILLRMAQDTTELSHVRADAYIALATCCKYFEEKEKEDIVAALEAALQDSTYRVRLNAARALGTTAQTSSVHALNNTRSLFACQDYPVLERIIEGIHKKQKTDPSKALQNQIEALEKQVATLQDNVAKLQEKAKHD